MSSISSSSNQLFQKWEIDSSLELVADQFTVQFQGAGPLLTAIPNSDLVTITLGLTVGGVPQTITFIDSGRTDEIEVTIQPDAIVGNKRGRDPSSFALDSFFTKKYLRFPTVLPPPERIFNVPNFPIIQVVVGIFRASDIAKEVVESVGLKLRWGCRDYLLQEDFIASGRVIDIIRQLIAPWQLLEPVKVDVYLQGHTLIVQQRNLSARPKWALTAAQLKQSSITIRKRQTNVFNNVVLYGAAIGAIANTDGSFVEGQQELDELSESFAPDGTLLSRVSTVSIYASPSAHLLNQVKETYTHSDTGGLLLSARETITNEWQPTVISTFGPVAPPVQASSLISREGLDPDTNVLLVQEEIDIGYTYDSDGFQNGSTQLSKKLNQGNTPATLDPTTLTVKAIRNVATLITEQTTEVYTFGQANRPGVGGNVNVWTISTRDTQQSGGRKPGGPRALPRLPIFLAQNITPGNVQASINVSESNSNWLLPDLQFVMAQYVQCSGLFEYELSISGVSMPWITRGQYIQITGLVTETGAPITLPLLLVTEVVLTYDESVPAASTKQRIRAFGWRKT